MEQNNTTSDISLDIETYMGKDWMPRLEKTMLSMSQHCLRNVPDVRTVEQAAQANRDLEDLIERDRDLIVFMMRELGRNGERLLVVGDFNSPEGHAFFTLIGAQHLNVRDMHFFAIPLDRLIAIRKMEAGEVPDTPVNEHAVVPESNETEAYIAFIHLVIQAEIDAVMNNTSKSFDDYNETQPGEVSPRKQGRIDELERLRDEFEEKGRIENHGGQVLVGDKGFNHIMFNHPEHPHYKVLDGSLGRVIVDRVTQQMPENSFATRLLALIKDAKD